LQTRIEGDESRRERIERRIEKGGRGRGRRYERKKRRKRAII